MNPVTSICCLLTCGTSGEHQETRRVQGSVCILLHVHNVRDETSFKSYPNTTTYVSVNIIIVIFCMCPYNVTLNLQVDYIIRKRTVHNMCLVLDFTASSAFHYKSHSSVHTRSCSTSITHPSHSDGTVHRVNLRFSVLPKDTLAVRLVRAPPALHPEPRQFAILEVIKYFNNHKE